MSIKTAESRPKTGRWGPCPQCRRKRTVGFIRVDQSYQGQCKGCGHKGPKELEQDDAIISWNLEADTWALSRVAFVAREEWLNYEAANPAKQKKANTALARAIDVYQRGK